MISRSKAKRTPRKLDSSTSMGILIVAQEPRNITAFAVRTPFSDRDLAIGKAANNGPAAAVPKKMAKIIPCNPLFSPK